MISKSVAFIKRPVGIASVVAVVVIIAAIVFFSGGEDASYDSLTVVRGDVQEEVGVTGKVFAATDVDLAFERSGRVAEVRVTVGDMVKEGQVLATLDNARESASLAQARANVQLEQVTLNELLSGSGEIGIGVSADSVRTAEIELENARASLNDSIMSVVVDVDSTIRTKVDGLFDDPNGQPTYGVSIASGSTSYFIGESDFSKRLQINSGRKKINDIFSRWSDLSVETTSSASIDGVVQEVEADIVAIQNFLTILATSINSYNNPGEVTAQSIYDGYRSDVSTARSSVSTALTTLRSARQAYELNQSNLEKVRRQLQLTESTTSEDVELQRARLASAEAELALRRATYNGGVIYAPVDGVVTSVSVSKGESVSASASALRVVSDLEFEITVYIPEADIPKVTVGDTARVTLDAYGRDAFFEAKVVSVDLSETVIDGVATYKTTLQFSEKDERIRAGMTANVDIVGNFASNVLMVPQRAVVYRGNERVVRVVQDDGEIIEVPVEVGLRGVDGGVEIKSGLTEGQEVITFIQE